MQGIVCRATDVGVLLGLSGLDMLDGNSMFFSPFLQRFTDVFRAIVDPYGAGLTPPFNDPIKAPDHPLGWQREVDLDPQAFPIEVVQHVQQPECPAIPKPIRHEIHRPGYIRRIRHRSASGLSRFSRLRGLIRRFSSSSQ